jgi:hypothetical protein
MLSADAYQEAETSPSVLAFLISAVRGYFSITRASVESYMFFRWPITISHMFFENYFSWSNFD